MTMLRPARFRRQQTTKRTASEAANITGTGPPANDVSNHGTSASDSN